MQLRARRADSFRKHRFDIHVHVFERAVPLEFARLDLFLDRTQSGLDLSAFGGRYGSRASERCGVRDRSGDIVAVQPPIKRNRLSLQQVRCEAVRQCLD